MSFEIPKVEINPPKRKEDGEASIIDGGSPFTDEHLLEQAGSPLGKYMDKMLEKCIDDDDGESR